MVRFSSRSPDGWLDFSWSMFILSGRRLTARPLLMGEVSKFAKDDRQKLLGGRELGEIDSVKKVSILIDE